MESHLPDDSRFPGSRLKVFGYQHVRTWWLFAFQPVAGENEIFLSRVEGFFAPCLEQSCQKRVQRHRLLGRFALWRSEPSVDIGTNNANAGVLPVDVQPTQRQNLADASPVAASARTSTRCMSLRLETMST